ncbi:MAG: hypothetical protein C0600_10640 [Ignavibacteria bacterium]|nr:MAG: hypothetical protein C0600_10640 [Ignavibacteria bacterium]
MKKVVSITSVFAIALTLFASSFGQAQSFTVASNTATEQGDVNGYIEVKIMVTNVTGNPLNLRVEVTDKSGLPADWMTQICFFQNCYPPSTDKVDGILGASEHEELDVAFITGAEPASGCVEVTLTNLDNANESAVMTFCASTLTSIEYRAPAVRSMSLSQNYPNPFSASKNSASTIAFYMPTPGNVSLKVYNLLGKEVRTLLDEARAAGKSSVAWDGRDNGGQKLPAGVYIYKLSAGKQTISKRMMFTR